jgi:signal transduction histidine kinase
MTSRRETQIQQPASKDTHGAPFIERVRRALGHDLHTPLGTIANYAAILEYQNLSKPEEVRLFAGRIRSSAMRMAAMLRQIAEAIRLNEDARSDSPVDVSALVRSLATEMNLRIGYPAHGREPSGQVTMDRELLTYTWKAFLAVNAEVTAGTGFDLDLEVEERSVTLWVGARPETPPAHVSASKSSDDATEIVPPESCFALGLAEWLVHEQGGAFGLWGRPGRSALRVDFGQQR